MTTSRRAARKSRMLAVAGVTAATLALGAGLTACGSEDEPERASSAGGSEQEQPSGEGSPDGSGEQGDSGAAEEQPTEEPQTDEGLFGAGETAEWEDGLQITVSAVEPYTPTEYAIGHTEGNDAYGLSISVENAGSEPIDITFILPTARAGADGVTAEEIFDETTGSGFDGELAPGRSATAEYAFSVPAGSPTLEIQIEPGLDLDASPATWELPL
ncbi:DUF4352 domain-containing protein [Streptomyces sp. DSM 44917]|uniref:DUF4352 domain-containing protein n=1 Tax=Streptomyces boetiae TaxID=3075541 RepID=A0ABU2LFX7_9ACTN|nr:DUF4352 domain-containing protein [Streptomyces sp. DSM 44917]MDT0310491.1 DUF4352 domain-containing protein [Streptomyces sp. DSM 44917]